jgi:8-oxo-dGTP pyrophosphatase MutT (NUDIX family)
LKRNNVLIDKLKIYFDKTYSFKEISIDEKSIVSSVAIILKGRAPYLELLFIKRAERAGDTFSGHMAFPGGVKEEADEDILSTAIRETVEEIGLDLHQDGELIGRFDDYKPVTPSANHFIVSPFIFYINKPNVTLIKNPDEVEDAIWIRLDKLKKLLPSSKRTANRFDREYQDYVFDHEGYRIWGMTGKILYSFITTIDGIK